MDFSQAIEYLFNRLPVFQNMGARAYKPGLSTTQALCSHLNNPQNRFKTIHVAGTNGKGSTSHMLASVLQKAGYKTGLYTSPHLKSFTERIRINGIPVKDKYISDFVTKHRDFIETISPSFFEITVAMAFDYFASEEVDVAVIEVGMGGRLDSTNVILPELSVITNISFDHIKQLGNTLPKIAGEKAGIIKKGVPVIISEKQGLDVEQVFISKSDEKHAPITFAADEWIISDSYIENGLMVIHLIDLIRNNQKHVYKLELTGIYQRKNILGVLSALANLRNRGWNIPDHAITEGLAATCSSTGLKGRWQILSTQPFTVCDTAHNFAGISEALSQFLSIPSANRIFILGFVQDKDVHAVLKLFPKDGTFYFCQPDNSRALPALGLQSIALEAGLSGTAIPDVNKAMEVAIQSASPEDTIYIGGSTFVVADIDNL